MEEHRILAIVPLNFGEISLEKAIQLREDLILAGLEAGFIDFEEIENVWMYVIPADAASKEFKKDKNEKIFSGGECVLLKVPQNWDREIREGIIGIGPGGKIIKEGVESIISEKEKKAENFCPTARIVKSAPSFSSPRHFGSFHINAVWTDEEFETRIAALGQFLWHSGFLSPEEMKNLWIFQMRFMASGQSIILLYLEDSPSRNLIPYKNPSPEREEKSEPEKPSEHADFNPVILNKVLKRRHPD